MIQVPNAPDRCDPRWSSDFDTISFNFQGKPDGWYRGYWHRYALTDDGIHVFRYMQNGSATESVYLRDITDLRINGKLIEQGNK